jgi:hypothetical protein
MSDVHGGDVSGGGEPGVATACSEKDFALVQQVKIEAVDEREVTFSTRATPAHGAHGADDNLRKTFVVARAEVWAQPIAGAPPAVALVAGAIGNLYLSREGWQALSPDGFRVFGAGTELPMFKYPWCAAGPRILANLSVVPTSIVVRGQLAGSGEPVAIELIGSAGDHDAAESQNIQWNGASDVALRLTARGAARLGLPAAVTTALVWPTRIVVTGSPARDLSVTGEVDLLDSESAGFLQHLAYDKRGQAVMLSLTLDGVSAFHVEPAPQPHA